MTSAAAARPQHRLALVRPGEDALAWFDNTLRDLQGDDLLQPVTVAAPSPYIAAVLRQRLAERGCANVSFSVQLRPVAERIARAAGSRAFERPLTGPLEAAAIRVAVRASSEPVLQSLATNRALQDSLGALFRELAHVSEADSILGTLAHGGGVSTAALRTYNAYVGLTAAFPDVPRQLRIAAQLARAADADPAWAGELGPILVYLPPRLDDAEQQLLQALGRHLPIAVALAWLDDPLADDPARATAGALAAALDTEPSVPDNLAAAPRIQVLSAPDPEEEARTVVRRVLAEMEVGVPLWRMAILYTAEDPYAALVRETLDGAGVPWHSALGRPAAAGVAARSLLALLGLRERGFAREAILDWLVARPTTSDTPTGPLPEVPISAWDRLSRRAQVVQGADQWVARFNRLIQTLEYEAQQRQDWHAEALSHEAGEDTPRPGHELEHARAIVAAIRQLDEDTRPPAEPATWAAMVEWASRLRHAYISADPSWPESERLASDALDAALESLGDASELEPTTTIGVFRDALASALDARRLSEGRPGVGLLVAPLGSSTGASFDRTFVLGLAEGLLPSRPSADLLAAGASADQADPLGRRARQRSTERRAFLGALAEHVLLSFARTDGAARASYPSRWLLEQVARIEQVPSVYASDLPRLFGPARPWLSRIASAYDGVQRGTTALNLADLRLRDVVTAHAAGGDVSESAAARRADLVLGRALRAARARRSREFTEFDGNLAAFTAESRRIARPFASDSRGSSATALERWAGCPYQYFMVNVLRVEATERPEEEWRISALDKGTLVHAALEQFFCERFEQGRSRVDEPFGAADHDRLEEIASTLLIDLEQQGRTGHAVVWDNARAALLRDLHMQLDREEAWRQEEGLAPAFFERTFGDVRDPQTWPAVELPLGDGSVVRFRGAIDRVDLSPMGEGPARALVIDYKSGGTWGYDGLDADPVLAGRHLQLALYARAVRASIASQATEVGAEFRFVSSKGKFERRRITADDRVDERLVEVVQHAANGIRAGVFLPMPGERDRASFKNCRYCDYDRICSAARDEAWDRKHANASFVPLERLQ